MKPPQLPQPAVPDGEEPQGPTASGTSFWDHLGELRKRLVYIALFLVGGFFVAWAFREPLFQLATAPIYTALAPYGIYRLLAIHTGEAMLVYVKLCFVAALMFTFPFSIYQLWAFLKPGLLPHEIRPIRRVVVLAMFLFVLGVIFCFRVVLPFLIDFMASFTVGAGDVDFQLTMDSAYSTTLNSMLMFGAIFELPLAMVLLTALPILNWKVYLKYTRYAIVLSFVVGAILTPPDVVSQVLMSVPLCGLYGVGILLSWLLDRARKKGRPVRGVDWGLAAASLSMVAVMLPFLWPRSPDPRSSLPPGLQAAVSVSGDIAGVPPCPGLPELPEPEGVSEPESGEPGLWVCSRYKEGALLITNAANPAAALATCQAAEAQWPSYRCIVSDRTVVFGSGFLVAAWEGRREQGVAAASPLTQVLGKGTVLFARASDSGEVAGPYLLAFFPAADGGAPSVVLGAKSAADASGLELLVNDVGLVKPGHEAASPMARQEMVLLKLTEAMEGLTQTAFGVSPAASAALAEARSLLGPASRFNATSSAGCDSLGCFLEKLLPLLTNPSDVSREGRQLVFTADQPSVEELNAIRLLLIQ